MKANKTIKGKAVPNDRKRKDKKVKSNTDLAAHNQTLNKDKLHDRDHSIFINTNTEC
jgi:PBP1b-binding outer membrane lipoprotein LpoB